MESALNPVEAGALFAGMLSDPSVVEGEVVKDETPAEETPAVTEEVAEEEVQADPDAEVSEEKPEVFTVKTKDGTEIEVTLDELKLGYQRQADYTRKTMEVAESRKAADAEMQKAQEERMQYAQQLEQQQIILLNALTEQSQTNWQQLLDSDPVEYLKQQHLFQQRQAALQNAQQEASKLQQRFQAEQKESAAKYQTEQQELLLAKLPEWKDADKAKAGKAEITEFLLKDFTRDEVAGLSDHRMVVIARKAMLYDQMIAKAQAASKKLENVPQKVQRVGNGANPVLDKRSTAFQQLKKSGSVEDAGRLFASLL